MARQRSQAEKTLLKWRRDQVARALRRRVGLLDRLGRSNRLFPRKLVLTRDGKWIIAIALLLGIGAVNTGNNLLYLVLSLLISVITISGILSEWTLRNVKLRRAYPTELVVDQPTLLRVEVDNAKRAGAFNLEIGELVDEELLATRAGYVLHLPGGEKGQCFVVARPLRRGPLETGGLRISTRYPFGFARKSRIFEEPTRFVVLPAVGEVDLDARGLGGRGDIHRSRKAGFGGEFRGLRQARQGDALRDIHWKVSARRDRLIAREWEAEASRLVVLHFAHLAPDDLHDPILDPHLDPQVLDRACTTVAGIADVLLTAEMSVGLRTLQGQVPAASDKDGGAGQLQRLRRHLAELICADRRPPAQWAVSDDAWIGLCGLADANQTAVAQRRPLHWAGGGAAAHGEVWLIRWAARPDVAMDTGRPDVEILLDSRGAIESIEQVATVREGAA